MASWHPDLFAAEVPFPQYAEITANVNFWIKIYSLYTTSQAVVHDSVDLNIIYEVIDVKPFDAPGSRTINRKSMDMVRNKYETILRKLASGQKPANAAEAQRVAALFGDKVERDVYSRAVENVRFQIGQKDRFTAGLIRSGAYIEQIREIFKANGLPEDLAYLPHVESSFNVKAYSKSGA
ncbi:MAG: lytic transglycosylase, partial [Bacteroidetes bacterium]|nr:lytic transglycosylase [Bacteroidota bacterium]